MSVAPGLWQSWPLSILETLLATTVVVSTTVTIFLLTLPSPYSHFHNIEIDEDYFDENDRTNGDRSGYNYFSKHKNVNGKVRFDTTVQVVVLGDIGRSPRMQYHALSIASRGGMVSLVGYLETEVHPDIDAHGFINVVPIQPFPKFLQVRSRALFLLLAPLKVLWQVLSLYYTLAYRVEPTKWMLVQNPPSIPTLAVTQFVCFFRRTCLIIDWHNFGYSILALRLGPEHPLVKLAERYERKFCNGATAHFAVTDAMAKVLRLKWNVNAITLHDRPPVYFQPLSSHQRDVFLNKLPDTAQYAKELKQQSRRLIVSSTSWTPDEDFSILLEALVGYSSTAGFDHTLPKLLAIITGKGPQKDHYTFRIRELSQRGILENVVIKTAWLDSSDYASLLGAADLGVSLHTSSSGVDLPMKVVDMFGAGLPVVGWSAFEAWPELVKEGQNGCGFSSVAGLNELLQELFAIASQKLQRLREGALEESRRRWDDEWVPTAGRLLELKT